MPNACHTELACPARTGRSVKVPESEKVIKSCSRRVTQCISDDSARNMFGVFNNYGFSYKRTNNSLHRIDFNECTMNLFHWCIRGNCFTPAACHLVACWRGLKKLSTLNSQFSFAFTDESRSQNLPHYYPRSQSQSHQQNCHR